MSATRLQRPFVKAIAVSIAKRSFVTTVPRQTTWGFIGLGQMGYPMAKNLRAKVPETDTLVICDTNTAASKRFAEEVGIVASSTGATGKGTGIHIASSPREVAEKSDTVITVLPEPKHVKAVFQGILEGNLPKTESGSERLFIDCSTIDPTTSREVASSVQSSKSGRFVDAPMSGGVVGARAGTLTFMLGAPSDAQLLERVKAVLILLGKRVVHLGDQGAGLSGKLANNYLLAINNIATAEAMNLGIRWGLDPKVLGDLINTSTGRCWPSEINNPVAGVVDGAPASRDYEGGFGVSLMKKDLKLAIAAAQESGAKLELAERAEEIYSATEAGHKGKDFSVVYKYIQE